MTRFLATTVEVNIDDLVDCIAFHPEAIDILLAIDLRRAELEFIEELILKLLRSARKDYQPQEWAELLNQISKIKP